MVLDMGKVVLAISPPTLLLVRADAGNMMHPYWTGRFDADFTGSGQNLTFDD